MSEELKKLGFLKHGRIVGNYQFYNIGATTLNQLSKSKIIYSKNYNKYGSRKPDALLVDRRDLKDIKVICVVENKDTGKFDTEADKTGTVQQCNDVCQVLGAEIGIATDSTSFVWFNPKQPNPQNDYKDKTTGAIRSYTIIEDEKGNDLTSEFSIDQNTDELNISKLSVRTRTTIQRLELVRKSLSPTSSAPVKEETIDPTDLAKQIWQDVWSVTGATPEPCLYSFLELFIFKYLSDLNILTEDDKGNKINFNDIYQLGAAKAFKNYTQNVRPYLRVMFPPSDEDNTTIINGTVLNPNVNEHSAIFFKILQRFKDFGPLRSIDPNFKSKVFAEFMKETISRKNWGQFFTPRNIIDAMVEMSGIESLEVGSQICDPACGVGGFILEPMKVHPQGPNFYYTVEGDSIKPRYVFVGYDKGFEKEQQIVIILAKANMLIFLSDLLKNNPNLAPTFSKLFNSTFKLLSYSILGTLSITELDKYDLILTNPPYAVRGSGNFKDQIKNDTALREYYTEGGLGVESLFLQWIVRSLKPSRKAFVILPEGILNRVYGDQLRLFVKSECIIDAIISLPVNAFYRNPEKTYIIAMTKKPETSEEERKAHIQTEPVFTYLVSKVGETLDVKRFPTPDENDLIEAVSLFNQFKGSKNSFKSTSKRCKIQNMDRFDPTQHWSVDRWWTRKERVDLGIEEADVVMSLDDFKEKAKDAEDSIHQLVEKLESL